MLKNTVLCIHLYTHIHHKDSKNENIAYIHAFNSEHALFKIHFGVHLMFAYKFQSISFNMGPLFAISLILFQS